MNKDVAPSNPEKDLIVGEMVSSLSREAKIVIQIVTSKSVVEVGKITKTELTEVLREAGWQWKIIWQTFKEIKRYLSDRDRMSGSSGMSHP